MSKYIDRDIFMQNLEADKYGHTDCARVGAALDKAAVSVDDGASDKEILIMAIDTYGDEAQEELAIEECAELIQAINHKHRGREHNIAEEIADVEIMLEQLKIINNCGEEVKNIRREKVVRLYSRIMNGR